MVRRVLLLMMVFVILSSLASHAAFANSKRGIDVQKSGGNVVKTWGRYHALIIGINQYRHWNRLQTAVKDAEVLKQILVGKYGFADQNVVLRTDAAATRSRIIADLRQLAAGMTAQDNLLIYFAGHGQLDELTGDGYWIPVEGRLKDPSTWISHFVIKSILSSERIQGKNIVVIADSCYSGSLLRGGPSLLSMNDRSYRKKLAQKASRRSRQVITSGGIEPVADGGKDGHSLFAYYFLQALKHNRHPVIDLENLFHAQVWKPVTEIGDQRPNLGRFKTPMDEEGQFVLTALQLSATQVDADAAKQREQDRLAEEQARIEKQRRELEAMRKLVEEQKMVLEQRQKLEAERAALEKQKREMEKRRLQKEKKERGQSASGSGNTRTMLAYAPNAVKPARVTLRSTFISDISRIDLREIVLKYGFFEKNFNHNKRFQNNFVDNGDGTISDQTTGLMWQKGGSNRKLSLRRVSKYIDDLNAEAFAGHADWRVPTLEELASLTQPSNARGQYISELFDGRQSRCWSVDKGQTYGARWQGYWLVSFKKGEILDSWLFYGGQDKWGKTKYTENHVRAVRSMK